MKTRIFLFIINIMFRKEIDNMALVYAYLIMDGKREFKNVPAKIKQKVKEALTELGFPELAEE